MTNRSPNGGVKNGATLQGDAQFFTVHTVIAHEAGDFGVAASGKQNLQVLVDFIKMATGIKYVNVSSAVVDLSVAGNRTAHGLGTNFNQAATTIYTLKFMTPMGGFLAVADLLEAIQGVEVPFKTVDVPANGGDVDVDVYETADAATKNINVISFDNL